MPFTDNNGSSSPMASFGRSIWSTKREGEYSLRNNNETSSQELEFQSFQKHVADRFHDLLSVKSDEFLSIAWVSKLLNGFFSCLDEFRAILLNNKSLVSKPPSDRLINEFFERSVKALDLCNATRDGIEKIRSWKKHLEIVLLALENRQRGLAEGQFRRSKKALTELALGMLEEKDTGSLGSVFSQRNRSFGRHNTGKGHTGNHHSSGHSRSLSWSVSHTWSAAKQLQSIASNLVPPRANDVSSSSGLAVMLYTMNTVLVFVLWVLVASIPCQDRGLNIHFSIPRQFLWCSPILLLYDRILEESKKRDRRNSSGLLKEIYQVEKLSRHMMDLIDSVQFPLTEEVKMGVQKAVQEVGQACEGFSVGLDPLECQIREMFRKIMSCRIEGLDLLSKAGNLE